MKKKFLISISVTLAILILGGGAFAYKQHVELLHQQEELENLVSASGGFYEWVSEQKANFQDFSINAEEQEKLNNLLISGKNLKESDYKGQIAFVKELVDFEASVKNRLDEENTALWNQLSAQEPEYATQSQRATLKDYSEKAENLIKEGKYKQFEALVGEWNDYIEVASKKKEGYKVSVVQYDFSEFPKIRLYLDVRNENGENIKNLNSNMFFVSEKDAATGDFLRCSVEKAVLMNENERLNIDLLADTSGSMSGRNMDAAKSVMHQFIGTVQFGAGDKIKLTPFNSDIDKTGYFTSDAGQLNSEISSYYATGGTKLYDSIIYGVQDVSGQEGAKCVIAFTDGLDEHSYNTAQDVIDVVSRYQIPVFIVRIGDSSTSGADYLLNQIAQASGGSFKNMGDFNSGMNEFYNQIYRQIKEYYVVEYDTNNAMGIMNEQNVSVYVQDDTKGGEADISITAGEEFFESLLGSYLRSYITDMNNHRYDQLEQYVDSSIPESNKWAIQWQMKKQVTGGFSNVTEETLMDYRVLEVKQEDENTIKLKASENYDVMYDEVVGDLRKSQRSLAKDMLQYLENMGYTYLEDYYQVRVWARVNQKPEYILRKGSDGKWKFAEYADAIAATGEEKKIYSADLSGNWSE